MKIDWLPQNIRREKIFGLDAFRGIAAMLVLLFHFWGIYWYEKPVTLFGLDVTTPFAAGHIGVDMFFVISGFLIFLSLTSTASLKTYFRKRILRLVPLAWFFTTAIFLLQLDFSTQGWANLLTHLTFTQSFFPGTYHGLNPVMWTLSVEALFYLLLPLLLFCGRKKWWHFWGILLVLTILNFWYRFHIIQFFDGGDQLQRVFYSEQLWGRFDQFVLGIGLGNLWLFREKVRIFVQKMYSIFMLLGGILFFGSVQLFAHFAGGFREVLWLQLGLHSLVACGFAIFLAGFLFAPHKIQKIFAPKSFLFLGLISYSIYLWHFPVLLEIKKYTSDPLSAAAAAIISIILLSTLSFYAVEKPFLKKKAGGIGF